MKIQVISDSHGKHGEIKIEEGIDMLIHCGDSTNYYELIPNEGEFRRFLEWFLSLDVKYKVLIAGNHDASLTKKYNVDFVKSKDIIYLEHEYATIEGLKIFGSPYTPIFNNWHFMKDRSKLNKFWEYLEPDIDILITHGPPRGILDLSRNRDNELEYCGDKALLNHVLRVKPKYHVFGHIHDFKDCLNFGSKTIDSKTIFLNASCVEDGKFNDPPKHHGHIIEL